MKGTKEFKAAIQTYLDNRAKLDPSFAKNLAKENKNIDDCVTYIINEVSRKQASAFSDSEIYGMAVHYYDEESIKVGPRRDCTIVSPSTEPKVKTNKRVKKVTEDTQQLNLFS